MAEKNFRCAPQNYKHFEVTCKSSECKVEDKKTDRFGVITYKVSCKTVKGLEKFTGKLKP